MHRLHHGRLPARLSLIALCLGLAAPASAQTGSPLASPLPLSISAQPLDKALTELAAKTGLLIGVDSSLLAGKQAPAINGRVRRPPRWTSCWKARAWRR
ncbi:hypothetical protein [Thauera sp. SDU_THAU2]|uniref:hypothetical protein n=1 Tax=Thauera sp. SDU_THAU2 TaxID=3136633 RepID=UPI00312050D1